MIHKKRDEIQNEAVNAWVNAGMKGTTFLHTGSGKMFVFIFATKHLKPNSNILFLAETTVREKDLYDNIEKFKQFFGYDLLDNHKITFMCYQSAYKLKDTHWDMVCGDEIQDGLSAEYSKFFFNNTYDAILCLSATLDDKAVSYTEESGKEVTKGELLAQIAPVCYRYTINQAQEDNTTRKLNVYVIMHRLDANAKTIEAGSKLKRFKTTEKAAYDYWDNEFKKSLFMPESIKEFKIRTSSAARAKVLYQLPSKINACKELLSNLDKTILFGNDLKALEAITPNVVKGTNSEDKNRKILKNFEDGKISDVASFKLLKQGISINGLKNIILHSYYTKELDLVQRLGRARLETNNSEANVFIFCTIGTVEEKWFNKMIENINLNLVYCKDVQDVLNKIKTNAKEI
jgi:superfamily II DNA or RNA helicase